ncbi:MAG: polyprenyl synthetase family protein, partial [Candidatus Fonsibacter lacus]|jgi:farnesyl diphosphate synthase|uniref:Polyprenyl synthetase family protein n=1 Tax=Candidatus Fonsibacter lacus TaxID=2576439 RepID=A0A845S9K0_9PROT|nr:polyprenyl synthetase family protein [Candidatus Fonsibacter lacus]NBQ00009.1 polyprenyl synthetase family protein [Pseudomonadota bacterium]NBP31084.1 polyprenyl synthetase family protein [Candidatus Fonsibacter lacus]NBQ46424.1 polyprenyl synthetase family protein [Pseudomonadota bacterium]NBY89929.1 polyprenyl synthetase family protein [Candidatus Fonsibacter lacus]
MNVTEKNIGKVAKDVDIFLKKFLSKKKQQSKLYHAIKYGLFSGGKKFRSYLVINSGKLFNLNYKNLIVIGAAVECMHSYSLIHDDLPSMDNDDYRRGKKSTHKVFGESTAILAGNSLLTLAFEILTSNQLNSNYKVKSDLVYSLASSAGYTGIAGGQFLDLKFEKMKVNKNLIVDMQNKKTGELISFCLESAAILSGKNSHRKFLKNIGMDLGLLFQITDDLLDIFGDTKKIGKPTRRDNQKGKATIIKNIGVNKTIEFCYKLVDSITERLKNKYRTRADSLIDSVNFLLRREH